MENGLRADVGQLYQQMGRYVTAERALWWTVAIFMTNRTRSLPWDDRFDFTEPSKNGNLLLDDFQFGNFSA